jgi:hypothetical protein
MARLDVICTMESGLPASTQLEAKLMDPISRAAKVPDVEIEVSQDGRLMTQVLKDAIAKPLREVNCQDKFKIRQETLRGRNTWTKTLPCPEVHTNPRDESKLRGLMSWRLIQGNSSLSRWVIHTNPIRNGGHASTFCGQNGLPSNLWPAVRPGL